MESKNTASEHFAAITLNTLFEVRSGDYHAAAKLDPGSTPLISCGNPNNGLNGYFDIPSKYTYAHCITVGYNGFYPLAAKFHPYTFAAKDDVAVLIPQQPMKDASLLYIAAAINRARWRYGYGRKCFREKLQRLEITVPVREHDGVQEFDEDAITRVFAKSYREYLPKASGAGINAVPLMRWRNISVLDLFDVRRGDFHSLTHLDPGPHMTVSRVTENNGVVGSYKRPAHARLFKPGHLTVSTVGGDAFVQLTEFMATDNVIICTPKINLRVSTLFFITFVLNHQKWRYSYGRQCYLEKFRRIVVTLPVTEDDKLDEEVMEQVVSQTTYWSRVYQHLAGVAETLAREHASLAQLALPLA